VRITDILTSEELIAPNLRATSKSEVLSELAHHLALRVDEVEERRLVEVLWERERLGSTAIGDGIAIPHGKLPGLRGVVGMFGRHPAGVDFDSLDGNPTRLFFLLVAPDESVGQHLKALARVSRLLKDADFRKRLIEASSATEILTLIRNEDEKL
jgi:PTS system nitrogen regulatory IIA component